MTRPPSHREAGRGGVEQIAALARAGVRAEAIILSHVDKRPPVRQAGPVLAVG